MHPRDLPFPTNAGHEMVSYRGCEKKCRKTNKQLEVQRRAEDDRVWPLKHLRGLIELFLKLNVPNDFGRLGHLSNQLLQPPEHSN